MQPAKREDMPAHGSMDARSETCGRRHRPPESRQASCLTRERLCRMSSSRPSATDQTGKQGIPVYFCEPHARRYRIPCCCVGRAGGDLTACVRQSEALRGDRFAPISMDCTACSIEHRIAMRRLGGCALHDDGHGSSSICGGQLHQPDQVLAASSRSTTLPSSPSGFHSPNGSSPSGSAYNRCFDRRPQIC